jgi:hypothetical protein
MTVDDFGKILTMSSVLNNIGQAGLSLAMAASTLRDAPDEKNIAMAEELGAMIDKLSVTSEDLRDLIDKLYVDGADNSRCPSCPGTEGGCCK